MRPWSPLPIAAFSSARCSPGCVLSLVFAVLLAGSVTGPALAAGMSLQNVDRWAKHPALQPFNVSSKELPSSLFLVRTRGQLPETDGVVVYGTHNGVFLVSGNATAVRSLSQRGCKVIPLRDLPEARRPVAREWVWIDAPDPAIVAMVDQVRWEGVRDKIRGLVRFGTRYSFAPNHHAVAQSIGNVFETYGLQSTLRSFKFRAQYQYKDSTMWNVEATQTGTTYPNSYVIICGHFDSVSQMPMHKAPGADDNATGTAAVLTAAEILSRHAFEYSIRYICFGGEEQGLVGSNNYSRWAYNNDLDIVGVLNFDMLGYWEPGMDRDLEIETNRASQWLAEAVVNAADLYTDTPYELHVFDFIPWGDHWCFLLRGYAAVNHEESWDWVDPDFNPYYHTAADWLKYVDPGFTVGNIQIGVAALATLAGYVPPRPVSFDMRPGSCRNPLNPKSRGVVPALVLGSVDFNVHDIDVSSLRIEESVSPSKIRIADKGSTSDGSGHPCAGRFPDGIEDLSLEFSTQDIGTVLGVVSKGDIVPLHLTGRLVDGTHIEGEDVVAIVGSDSGAPRTQGAELPTTFVLHPNVPNPFNPTTTISFALPEKSYTTLSIYNIEGKLVRTLINGNLDEGFKEYPWDGTDAQGNAAASGVYFYRLKAGKKVLTKKMVLLR